MELLREQEGLIWKKTRYTTFRLFSAAFRRKLIMDSLFLEELVKDQWTQAQTRNPYNKWQYYNDKFPKEDVPSLAFNTDVSLLKELTPVDQSNPGQNTNVCSSINDDGSSCPDSEFAQKTRFYAEQGNAALVPDFLSVYYKMVTTTMENVELVEATGSGSSSLAYAGLLSLVVFFAH